MVQEPLGVGGGYWLPAGRVDPGEKLRDGGVRETLEEAGVHIAITRVLKFNLTNALRIIYLAHPVDSPNGELHNVLLNKIRSKLVMGNFLVILKLFLNAKCSLSQTFNLSTL